MRSRHSSSGSDQDVLTLIASATMPDYDSVGSEPEEPAVRSPSPPTATFTRQQQAQQAQHNTSAPNLESRANTLRKRLRKKVRPSGRIGAQTKAKTRTRTGKARKESSLRLTKKLKDLIKTFIDSEPVSDSLACGSDGWKRKLFTFLKGNNDRVVLDDVNRWIESHPWIVRDALARRCRVAREQLEQSQSQNQNQNHEQGQVPRSRSSEALPQENSANDNNDIINRKRENCMEAQRCIIALSNVLHREQEFRSALVNLTPIATQIFRVHRNFILGIPREEMLNRDQKIRIKQDVSSTSQNHGQGQGQGQGQGGQPPGSDEDED